jgi:hypothetical protein
VESVGLRPPPVLGKKVTYFKYLSITLVLGGK